MSCQVKVEHGILQGKECVTYYGKKYYSFEGIPYAKPPVGKLRFKAPEKLDSWEGIRKATKPGNKSYQINPYGSIEGSEDSLYLNVYTPSLQEDNLEKLPVLFFIHGGRFIFGYGDYYKPDYLIKNDVVLVTINYRLNILGFLCLNIPEVSGNMGLKDIVMALRWVNTNIGVFNGDANNITAMGESAGGGATGSLLTSKMADKLFHKVIMQSGAPISDLYMIEGEDPVEKARLVASYLGKELTDPRRIYEFLVDVPIENLMVAFSLAEICKPVSIINSFFLPVVEKKFQNVERFFDEYPRNDIASNRYNKVPILIGMLSHEGALFLQKDDQKNIQFENDFSYFIPRYIQVYEGNPRASEIEIKLREFYFDNREVNNATKTQYIDMISDLYVNIDTTHMAECLAKSTDVFFYKFEYSGNMNTRVLKNLDMKGASHGDMMQYQFYRKEKHDKCTPKDLGIVNMLSESWCNFAKHGAPSWSGQETKWLPYTPTEKNTLVISDKIELVKNPDIHRYKFWQGILGEFSKL